MQVAGRYASVSNSTGTNLHSGLVKRISENLIKSDRGELAHIFDENVNNSILAPHASPGYVDTLVLAASVYLLREKDTRVPTRLITMVKTDVYHDKQTGKALLLMATT